MSVEGCGADAGYPTPGGGAPGRRVPQSQPSRQNCAARQTPHTLTVPGAELLPLVRFRPLHFGGNRSNQGDSAVLVPGGHSWRRGRIT